MIRKPHESPWNQNMPWLPCSLKMAQILSGTYLSIYWNNFPIWKPYELKPQMCTGLVINFTGGALGDLKRAHFVPDICWQPQGQFLGFKSHIKSLGSQMYFGLTFSPMGPWGPQRGPKFPNLACGISWRVLGYFQELKAIWNPLGLWCTLVWSFSPVGPKKGSNLVWDPT